MRCSTSASGPSEPDRERPYIQRNIAATRAAYGVDKVEITDYSAKTTATAGQLRADAEALPGIRLIDPNVVGPAFEQLQQVRGYYSFPKTLDVDRYTIDGKETDAVVAVREMDLKGVEGQNWNNLKTVYTHGYGLVAAYGNRRQSGGEPEWIVKDIPPTGLIEEHEPRIYFGEIQGSRPTSTPSSARRQGAAPVELDTPGGGEGGNPKTYTYTGKGGVPIGSLWHRLLYAAKFADVNILLSDRVNAASKIIYDRTPRERVQEAAPWLKVDGDAYPAVVDGPDRVDRRRLHDVELLPEQQAGRPATRSPPTPRPSAGRHRRRPAAGRHQLHPQLGQGRGRRLRRHGQAVRLGRGRPGAADLAEGVPGRGAAEGRDPGRSAGPPALPAGPVQGAAPDPGPLPHDRPGATGTSNSSLWEVPNDPVAAPRPSRRSRRSTCR